MKTRIRTKFIGIISALIFTSNLGLSQSNEIKIKFISNCGLLITDGTTNIYSDFPYRSGAFIYDKFDSSELDSIKENSIFIFTHKHGDHYSKKNMRSILKNKGGKKYGKWNIVELENLSNTIPDFKIKSFKNKHKFSFAHYSYLITWHGKKIYLSGDTESTSTIQQIKSMDWAFIPGWLLKSIFRNNIEIDTKMIDLYHIGRKDSIELNDPKILILDKHGTIMTMTY
ncbi:MAG: hypothetical protein ACJAV5_000098 [Vicingaceae bacterium]|jgi:hypothetical protein